MISPWAEPIEKITNAMEAADYNIRPLYKYVKEAESAIRVSMAEDSKKGRASTQYYLSQYLDQQKNKRK